MGTGSVPIASSVATGDAGRLAVTHPKRSLPILVRVFVDDGTERTEPGFAFASTKAHVLVQVQWQAEYYKGAREFWVQAERVKRCVIEPRIP
ncbi:hypothetical protein AHiyo8_00940 [Arthrobacter sp. Hiyo8]|nr:hypothetical protein AHiyo8_00940 [Arthrobacter sp. Hiyo8]